MTRILAITGLTEDEQGRKGSAGAGKDTVADFLVKNHGAVRVGLGDLMKRIVRDVYNFSDEQLWGPSHCRNAPDFRYPRTGDYAEAARGMYEAASGRADEQEMLRWGELGWLTPRHSLQVLGFEWSRSNYLDTWVIPVVKIARELSRGGYSYDPKQGVYSADMGAVAPDYIVVSDARFPNDLMLDYGALSIRVKRGVATLGGLASQHISEQALLSMPDEDFDFVLYNTGTLSDLEQSVRTMVTGLSAI